MASGSAFSVDGWPAFLSGTGSVSADIVTTMKAIAFNTPGDPDVLEGMELPDPEVGPGEVFIRVQATAVSPADTSVRARKRANAPIVVGMELAGVVDDVDDAAGTDPP